MFYNQVSKYWPAVHDYLLVPDYAGIRPKLVPPPYSHDASVSHSASITTTHVSDTTTKLDMINTDSCTTTTTATSSSSTTTNASSTATNPSATTLSSNSCSIHSDDDNNNDDDHTYNIPSTSDFNIYGRPQHGIPHLVCLYGIESPGLTSSLAIGNYVRDILLADKT